jgi:hypothetical protein
MTLEELLRLAYEAGWQGKVTAPVVRALQTIATGSVGLGEREAARTVMSASSNGQGDRHYGRRHKYARAETKRVAVEPGARHTSVYVGAAVRAELASVARAPHGVRNSTLNDAALKLARFVVTGELDGAELADALLRAALVADAHGPRDGERQARATIASGFRGAGAPCPW